MHDEDLDVEATTRVAHRALVSAGLAFVGGVLARAVLPSLVAIPFLIVALVVGISAARTLNHPEASVIGGARHFGIVLAILGALAAALSLTATAFVLLGSSV